MTCRFTVCLSYAVKTSLQWITSGFAPYVSVLCIHHTHIRPYISYQTADTAVCDYLWNGLFSHVYTFCIHSLFLLSPSIKTLIRTTTSARKISNKPCEPSQLMNLQMRKWSLFLIRYSHKHFFFKEI